MDEEERDALRDISDGASVGFSSLITSKVLWLSFSYIVTTLGSPALYGLISVLTRLEETLHWLFAGLLTSATRTIPRLDQDEQNSVITLLIPLVVLYIAIISILLVYFQDVILEHTILNSSNMGVLPLFLLSLVPLFIFKVSSSLFKSYKQIRLANLVSIIGRPFFYIVGFLISILLIGDTLLESWIGITFGFLILSILSIISILRYTDIAISNPFRHKDVIRDYLQYSSKSSISNILVVIQFQTVYVLMAIYLNPVQAGLFSLAIILSLITRWPLQAVNQIFPPVATELYSEENVDILNNIYKRTSILITSVCVPLAGTILIYNHQILTFFSIEYSEYTEILIVLVIGQFVAVICGSVGLLLMMTDNEKTALVIQLFIVSIAIYPLILATQRYGIYGLTVGNACIIILNNFLELFGLYKMEGLQPFTYRHGKLVFLSISIITPVYFVTTFSLLFSVVLWVVCLAVYYFIVWNYILVEGDRLVLKEVRSNLSVR